MSFQNQAFWLAKNPGCLDGADMTAYENSSRNGADMTTYENSSRIESKRPHQWFMDSPEVDLFPNKKPAVEVSSNTFLTGMPSSNTPSWGNSSCFQLYTGHFTEQLFEPNAATRTTNFENRNISSVSIDKLSVERKDKTEPFGGDSSFGLSISTTLEDPQSGFNYGGIRKVKVSEVKESENVMSVHTNNPYERVDNNTLSNSHAYKGGDNSMSTSLTYNKGDENIIFMDNACGRTDNNFISMGQSYNKGDDSLSMGQSYKEICDTILIDQGFSKVDSNVISIAQAYNKTDGNSMSRDHIFNNVEEGIITVGHTYYDKGGNNMPLVAHSFNKRGSTIISFGGCDDDDITPSGGLVSSYEQLMGQAPSHNIESMNDKQLVKSNSLSSTALTSASAIENVSKIKEEIKMSKKATSNNFPSNVRSLLSTGILDGVPIKYKAWSQEKELRGVIKGSGYLCSCQSCNFSKLINAYEFERHAGCKTKHPNNHIYFENGKTIYGIVQELRSTPQHMLFEVIQTITGSPINQKSFRSWKESFLAATKELQRIYGKDEEKQLS